MTNISGGSEAVTIYDMGTIGTVTASPGGSDTQMQYNNAGSLGGVTSWTTNGTTTFSGADNAVLSLGTGTDFSITHDATNTSMTSTTGNLTIDNTNATGQTFIDLGSDTVATALFVRNNSSVPRFTVTGGGLVQVSQHAVIGIDDMTGTAGTARLDMDASTFTDDTTAGSGTQASWNVIEIDQHTLAATNSSVTTTTAASLYIADAPTAGTNQTITNAYALLVDAGDTKLDGDVTMTSGTASTTKTTGALIVTGGVGISGDAYATSFNATSDATLKTNIHQLEDPLGKLNKLEGYSYELKERPNKENWGVIAQQLQRVGMEHLVSGEEGEMSVNYLGLIPLLIESVKELSQQVTDLNSKQRRRK